MVLVNKVVAILMLPSGLVFLFLFSGLLFRKTALLWAGALLFLLFSMPAFGDFIIDAVEGGSGRIPLKALPEADAIVVTGGMTLQVRGAPLGEWNEAADRFEGGMELYRAGKAPLLVFTRGRLPWRTNEVPEGELLAKRAHKLGVPDRAILLSGIAANTSEEASVVRRLFAPETKVPGKTIILVTSAYHMPRAMLLFERQGFRVIPYPVDFQVAAGKPLTVLSFLPDADAFLHSEKAARELIGLFFYRFINREAS